MIEYLKPFFENKCDACEKFNCVNTKLYSNSFLREKLEKNGVGRIRYDYGLTMSEHVLTIQDCPTRKSLENTRKVVGSGLGWRLVKGLAINSALRKLDPTISTKPDPNPPSFG